MSAKEPIRVWQSCGIFGWSINWPLWHVYGIYATVESDKPWIHIYSDLGQLEYSEHDAAGDRVRRLMTKSGSLASRGGGLLIGEICVDDEPYFIPHLVTVNWDAVRREVMRMHGAWQAEQPKS